jgi:hypothetical protein
MRTFIVLILSCASVLGADTGIRVVTTVKTNAEIAGIYTTDVYTRDGQTNLVRQTKTKAGVVQIRIQKFYHGGVLVGDYVAMKDSSGFTTEASIPYSVSFESGHSNELRSIVIGTKDGVILDAFSCTNGLLYPIDVIRIQQANELFGTNIDVEHVRKISSAEFIKEQEEWVRKYKEKYNIP